jgi:hypothetical protein
LEQASTRRKLEKELVNEQKVEAKDVKTDKSTENPLKVVKVKEQRPVVKPPLIVTGLIPIVSKMDQVLTYNEALKGLFRAPY